MKIEGKVSTIIFKNESNSWTVMLLKNKSDYITAVGQTDGLEVGDEIELEGDMTTHKVYGEQFKFNTYKKILPKTDSALIQYIADNVDGVGKKTARNIINVFGEDTINTIRFKPIELLNIKGLNEEKIENLSIFFNEEYERWNVINFLTDFGISVVMASKIYQNLGNDTIDIVKKNPYSLLMFVKTLDFKQVDEIAMKLGVLPVSEDRIESGIIYSLNSATEFGHTCLKENILIDYAKKVLNVSESDIQNGIIRLELKEKLYRQTVEEDEYIFRKSYYLAEENIANYIALKSKSKNKLTEDYSKYIEKIDKEDNINLSKEQKDAIVAALSNDITIITGGPGTGKTTIIKCIIQILEDINKKYVLCAPTGRAAKRITETTKREAKTIHRLLEITKLDNEDIDMLYNIDIKTLEEEVVIVDEASMIDTIMMNNLIKAFNKNTKVIFVGDVDQLPSVGPGNVLKDIISSNTVNTVYLKQIYRQSAQSDIILNAHKVNEGKYPEFKNNDTDMYFIPTRSIEDTISEISSLVSYRLETYAKFDKLKDLQILTPMKKTSLGTIQLNTMLQEVLNPQSISKDEKSIGERIFRVGDKVMQIQNNYDKRFDVKGEAKQNIEGVYNGDIGYINKIDNENKELTVIFDDIREISYDFDELDQLEHAYATTIHKSQGSEFNYVILPLYTGYPKLFTRNLLYTAMTRAKKMLIIVGSNKIINYMVDNIDSKNRMTGLKYKILKKIK